MPHISRISLYPIKSAGHIDLSSAWVEGTGLSFDRQFMLADAQGRFITARRFPAMSQINVHLHPKGLQVTYPGMPALSVHYDEFKCGTQDTQVWGDAFTAETTHPCYDAWFSQVLGSECQLLYLGAKSPRLGGKTQQALSFADGYPLLLIGRASLQALNEHCRDPHSMRQFRPNLVLDDAEAYAEDEWRHIRIGEVEFRLPEPCSRCVMTTIDLKTQQKRPNREPLSVLEQQRRDANGKALFGQNLIALSPGRIQVGDPIEVLETGPAPEFISD